MEQRPPRTSKKLPADQRVSTSIAADDGDPGEQLWIRRGVEDVFFQREAQVTWWTVLGGIAVAALLTQLEAVFAAAKSGQWVSTLYFITTCLVIVNSWVQTSWGSLVLRWLISIPSSLLGFFQGLSLSLAALSVTQPVNWFGAMSLILIAAILNQLYFMKRGAWVDFPSYMIVRFQWGIGIYLVFTIFSLIACLYLYLHPNPIAEIVYGIIAFAASCLALVWQHIGMMEEKKRMGIA